MTGALAGAAIGLAALLPFRHERPVRAAGGWSRLEIPDAVLDACRPGLPDLRVLDAGGREVPFARESAAAPAAQPLPVRNVESAPRRETAAEVDRGPAAGPALEITLEIPQADFLKPVVAESSEDRASWREAARGSVFAAGRVRQTTIRLRAPSDRRFWRIRLDDRNSEPVEIRSVAFTPVRERAAPERSLPLTLSPIEPREGKVSRYRASLPAANLAVASLRLTAAQPAYSRAVRVFERVLFRDRVTRRLVGEGVIARSPGAGGTDRVALNGLTGRGLEIEIDDGDSPPLTLTGAEASVHSPAILFYAPEGKPLRLAYGSPSAEAPSYDLSAALKASSGLKTKPAALGPEEAAAVASSPLAAPPRGSALDPEQWSARRPILLPPGEGVAYLDLDGIEGISGDLRISDAGNRQVPYIRESRPIPARRDVPLSASVEGTRTIALLRPIDPALEIDSVELTAKPVDYFSREVTVLEELRDERGPAGLRTLGSVRWEKRAEEPPAPLRIPIARPSRTSLRVEIENGDNAPLALASAAILFSRERIDFLYGRGDSLTLLAGNPAAAPPKFDLELLAGRILSAPAEPARLGPPARRAEEKAMPKWFWPAVAVSGVLVALALLRGLSRAG